MSAFLMSFIGSLACIISGFILGQMFRNSEIQKLQETIVKLTITLARKNAKDGDIQAQAFLKAVDELSESEASND